MATARRARSATFYVQVTKGRYPYEAKVAKITQKYPTVLESGAVVTKLKVTLPDEAWDPYEPEAEIVIPLNNVVKPVVVISDVQPDVCPECAQGKHPNCTGYVLDDNDNETPCQCPCEWGQ